MMKALRSIGTRTWLALIMAVASHAFFVQPDERLHQCPSSTLSPPVSSSSFTLRWSSRSSTARMASSSSFHDDDAAAALAHNRHRLDIHNFLTQRAIQSFIFVLNSCRDPHTVRWMEELYGWKDLENYHGTGAFNLTKYPHWDDILRDLLQRPPHQIIIAARRRGRGQGGWSRNNPYLEDRFVHFHLDLDPPSLVSRILSVRTQIATEWQSDLDTLVMANDKILQSYHDKSNLDRRDEEGRSLMVKEDDDDNAGASTRSGSNNKTDPSVVENIMAPYTDAYAAALGRGNHTGRRAFERVAMTLLSNKILSLPQRSSHNRKANFDLLLLLATQASIHRVLRAYRHDDARQVSFAWLRDYYVTRVPTFFDGNQEYGAADDFMDELLLTPPLMRQAGSNVELIDPLRVAEDVLQARSVVARDWKAELADRVPDDHLKLQRLLLAVRMAPTPAANDDEEKTSNPTNRILRDKEGDTMTTTGDHDASPSAFE